MGVDPPHDFNAVVRVRDRIAEAQGHVWSVLLGVGVERGARILVSTLNTLPFAFAGMLIGVMAGVAFSATMARRWQLLLDRPDPQYDSGNGSGTRRKTHDEDTPLVGGIVLLAALATAMIVVPFPWGSLWTLPFGLAALGLLGLLDDLYNLRAQTRLLLQFAIALVVVALGELQIQSLGNLLGFGPLALGPLAAPVTILSMMLIINAINMLDGIDGLAGSVVLIASVAFGVVAFTEGHKALGMISLMLVAGLTGFLFFNLRTPWRRRASVFLGDSGSMMLGFWMAWMAVALSQLPGSEVAPVTVALFLIFPAGDAFAVFIRRALRRRNPMHPDRGHTHHLLIRAGCTVSRAVTALTLLYALWVGFALLCYFRGCAEWPQFLLATAVFLGYIAFVVNGRHIIRWRHRVRRQRPSGPCRKFGAYGAPPEALEQGGQVPE